MLDRSISSTITVGGAANAGTFEAAELMVAGMNAREASGVLFEQNLVVADSESTRRRLATATTKHLSFLEDDALRFVANREYGWELVMWLALVTESYVFAACAREVAWLRLVVDEAALTSSDIGEFVERQRRVDPAMSTLTVKSGQKVRSEIDAKVAEVQGFIDSVLQPLAQRRTRLDLDDGVRINRLKLAYGWRSDLADLPQSAIGAATSEVKKGIATDLKWARGEIKKNNVWWS